jgi:NADPH2:quinone reductase
MKAMTVPSPGAGFILEERPVVEPGPGQVRIRVHACGICHSDRYAAEGLWPGLEFPRVPGHEVAGVVEAVGEDVRRLSVGDRVGVGWHGGHDGTCDACLEGAYMQCRDARITGLTTDGGYADSMVARAVACARVPDGMPLTEAAPLLCAGVTTYNALRNAEARSGDLVAIQGLGGLGHLGVQFARAMGFEVVALSRGSGKAAFARELGAHHVIDTTEGDVGESLMALGGAKVILATAPDAPAISALIPGLRLQGSLIVVGAPQDPIQVTAADLIRRKARIQGWASGTASDSTDTMAFAHAHDIHPRIETFPLQDAATGYARMMDGSVRFRSVLDMTAS